MSGVTRMTTSGRPRSQSWPTTYYGHPGAWKALPKASFCSPPWLTAVGKPGWLMTAAKPVPGGQVGGSALAGLATTPTAASAATDRSAPMRRLMKTHHSLVSPASAAGPPYKRGDSRASRADLQSRRLRSAVVLDSSAVMRSARFEGDEGRCNPSHAPGWLMFRPEMFQRSGCGKQRRHGASRCDRDRPDETVAYDK